ncbi:glycosyl transferase [Campylobacterota bacterium]|nr:glycosyl transferase [Campylobacterota bacterium]
MISAIRDKTIAELKTVGNAEIVIGVPSYNCEETIGYVLEAAAFGLRKYYPNSKAVIFVSDGGSTDDTREKAFAADTGNISKIVAIYRGASGKGTAFRQVFEAAVFLGARGLAIFESARKSITPEWVGNLLAPVLDNSFDFVAPVYKRYKFDAAITSTIAYNLTRAIYGTDISQPIGGDWALSDGFVKFLLSQDVWSGDITKYGVDIWMTTRAIVYNFRVAQARLGVKFHREKKPNDLSTMFYQVVGTIFAMMDTDHDFWTNIKSVREPPIFGEYVGVEPPSFEVDKYALMDYFKNGFITFRSLWREILDDREYECLERLSLWENGTIELPIEIWVKIVYRYVWQYHKQERQRNKLLSTLIPLYSARVASLIDALSNDAIDTTAYFEEQAKAFEKAKPELIAAW